ncbi:MAG: DUF72 domain-containing protein [Armatimonadota bacterium]
MPKLRIGTSGWSYRHWRDGVFYPPELKRGQELAYYSAVFDCVEINSSFYHTPRETTLETWRRTTPDGFLFAYKGSRSITHQRKLLDVGENVEFMIGRARLLEPKLGPILWQLPPSLAADHSRLEAFLLLLPHDLRHAFEFRHESWFDEATYSLLSASDCALVWSDTPRYPLVKVRTASFVYARLHGHEKLYSSCYSREELIAWAADFSPHLAAGADIYVFFDNDFEGHAPRNALDLRDIMSHEG